MDTLLLTTYIVKSWFNVFTNNVIFGYVQKKLYLREKQHIKFWFLRFLHTRKINLLLSIPVGGTWPAAIAAAWATSTRPRRARTIVTRMLAWNSTRDWVALANYTLDSPTQRHGPILYICALLIKSNSS